MKKQNQFVLMFISKLVVFLFLFSIARAELIIPPDPNKVLSENWKNFAKNIKPSFDYDIENCIKHKEFDECEMAYCIGKSKINFSKTWLEKAKNSIKTRCNILYLDHEYQNKIYQVEKCFKYFPQHTDMNNCKQIEKPSRYNTKTSEAWRKYSRNIKPSVLYPIQKCTLEKEFNDCDMVKCIVEGIYERSQTWLDTAKFKPEVQCGNQMLMSQYHELLKRVETCLESKKSGGNKDC